MKEMLNDSWTSNEVMYGSQTPQNKREQANETSYVHVHVATPIGLGTSPNIK